MLLPQLALGNGNEAGQPSFGGQEIVEAGVAAVLGDIEPNGQQSPRLVVQEVELGVAQL